MMFKKLFASSFLAFILLSLTACDSKDAVTALSGTLDVVEASTYYNSLDDEYQLMIDRFNANKMGEKPLSKPLQAQVGVALADIATFKKDIDGLLNWKTKKKQALLSMTKVKASYLAARTSYVSANTAVLISDEVADSVKDDMRRLFDDLQAFDVRVVRIWSTMEDQADITPEVQTLLILAKRLIQSVAVRE